MARRPLLRTHAVGAIPLVLVLALGADQGGFQPDAWVWAGALAAWAVAVAVVGSANPGALRREWPWLLATFAVLAWTLCSALWSVHASQSVLEARRTLLYALVVLALLVLARSGATETLVPATLTAISCLVAYALFRYLLGGRRHDEFELYTLSRPLGYANAVGILAALGLLLALGVVSGRAAAAGRSLAAAAIPLLAAALELSGSTASTLGLAAGLAVVFLLTTETTRTAVALALVAPTAATAAAVAWISRYSDNTLAVPRLSGGAVTAIVLGCAAASAAVAWRVALPAPATPSRRTRRLVLTAVVVVALAGAAAAATTGAKEPRASYFRVAWRNEYLAHPLLGSGAGTFGRYWVRDGKPLEFGGALDAHSLYLESLAELGPIGLLLVAAMLLAPLRGAVRRRATPLLPAAAGAYTAFLAHVTLDWDWEIPAVVVAALCCAGAVATAGLEPQRPLGGRLRAAVLATALVLGGCAIAGARSSTVPEAAAPQTARAPRRGALARSRA